MKTSVAVVQLPSTSAVRKMAKGDTILHAFQQLMYTHNLRHQWRSAREVRLGVAATRKRPFQGIDKSNSVADGLGGPNKASNRAVPAMAPHGQLPNGTHQILARGGLPGAMQPPGYATRWGNHNNPTRSHRSPPCPARSLVVQVSNWHMPTGVRRTITCRRKQAERAWR